MSAKAPYHGRGKPPLPKATGSRDVSPERPSALGEPLQPPSGAGVVEGGASSSSSLPPPPLPPPPGIGSGLSTPEQQAASKWVQEQSSLVASRVSESLRSTTDSQGTETSQAHHLFFKEDLESASDSEESERVLHMRESLRSTTDSRVDAAPEATIGAIEETVPEEETTPDDGPL